MLSSILIFYRRNPQCLDISVCDPYSGMTTTISLPDYFRRLYFPAKSTVEAYRDWETDRKSTRLNSSHRSLSRMPSSA